MESRYIILEGPDGSGKSTTANILEQKLLDKGINVVRVREFDSTPAAKEISKVVLNSNIDDMTRLLLVSAIRKEALLHVISPALEEPNTVVLADRGWPSTLAYQCKTKDSIEVFARIQQSLGLPEAYTVILHTDYKTALSRLKDTGKELDVIELALCEDEYKRLLDAYGKIMADTVIDTSGVNAEEAAEMILDRFLA